MKSVKILLKVPVVLALFMSLILTGCLLDDELNPRNFERYTTNVHVSGQLIDSCNGEPTPFIKVFWYDNTNLQGNSGDELIGETITDENGYFEIKDRPIEYIAATRNKGITGVSDSYISICLPDETSNVEIASGYLGATKFSEGNHDSNGDLGQLFAYRPTVQYQVNLPKLSPDGNPMYFDKYVFHSGGYLKSIEENTTNPHWTIFNCTYKYYKKFYIRDLEYSRPEQHDGYVWMSNGHFELIDSIANKRVEYKHSSFRFQPCVENGIIYPEYDQSEDL
jgi:hypothetical protein